MMMPEAEVGIDKPFSFSQDSDDLNDDGVGLRGVGIITAKINDEKYTFKQFSLLGNRRFLNGNRLRPLRHGGGRRITPFQKRVVGGAGKQILRPDLHNTPGKKI